MSMTRRKRQLPPMRTDPQNLVGLAYRDIEEITVAEYHPQPDGQGLPTQVHMLLTVRGETLPLIMRFMGPDTLDQMIAALVRHRQSVWPEVAFGVLPD